MNKQMYNEYMKSILNIFEEKALYDNIDRFKEKEIYLYGAGNVGRLTYENLIENNVNIEGFIDRNFEEIPSYMGKRVYSIKDIAPDSNKLIIICFLCDENELNNIMKYIESFGFENLNYFNPLCNMFICFDRNPDIYNKILEVSGLFEDEESQQVYSGFFKAIATLNLNYFVKPKDEIQYFINDIKFKKGYKRFIDCGAFDGDTVRILREEKGIVDAVACFEPEVSNFKNLCNYLKYNKVAKEQILFPCGVHSETNMLKFNLGLQTSSFISNNGNSYIQCVAIDDVLKNFEPSFIKMDIEGAEYDALLGAEETIKEYTPDLAISVYHNIKHMYEIPLLIHRFNPNYKFFLKSHGLFGMETILYAVCE